MKPEHSIGLSGKRRSLATTSASSCTGTVPALPMALFPPRNAVRRLRPPWTRGHLLGGQQQRSRAVRGRGSLPPARAALPPLGLAGCRSGAGGGRGRPPAGLPCCWRRAAPLGARHGAARSQRHAVPHAAHHLPHLPGQGNGAAAARPPRAGGGCGEPGGGGSSGAPPRLDARTPTGVVSFKALRLRARKEVGVWAVLGSGRGLLAPLGCWGARVVPAGASRS